MMKELLESGLQNSQSETNPNTCEDGCTCEKYGHEVDLNIDYEDLIHSHFMTQPETDDQFAFLDKVIIFFLYYRNLSSIFVLAKYILYFFQLNHLNNLQKMIKSKQNEGERLEQTKQTTENEESNQLDKESQEKKRITESE